MTVFGEETFGPVAAVTRFTDEDHSVELANDVHDGLGASVRSRDAERTRAIAQRVVSGIVAINTRGMGAPMLIVADGAAGLSKAIEHCWPASDRQRCCVHRARNLYAKLPERERERVRHAYWQALDDAINERDAKHRLQALVDELDRGAASAPRRGVWPTIRTRSSCICATHSAIAAGGGQRTCSSARSARSNGAPR